MNEEELYEIIKKDGRLLFVVKFKNEYGNYKGFWDEYWVMDEWFYIVYRGEGNYKEFDGVKRIDFEELMHDFEYYKKKECAEIEIKAKACDELLKLKKDYELERKEEKRKLMVVAVMGILGALAGYSILNSNGQIILLLIKSLLVI